MGRQHQGMDRPGVRQVPEGSGEERKMEETGCEVICGAPTTLAVKGKVKLDAEPASVPFCCCKNGRPLCRQKLHLQLQVCNFAAAKFVDACLMGLFH